MIYFRYYACILFLVVLVVVSLILFLFSVFVFVYVFVVVRFCGCVRPSHNSQSVNYVSW